MLQIVENTYNAFEQFIEGELNQYDLASLIEDEIISAELLDAIMEEAGLYEEEYDDYEEELEEGAVKKTLGALAIAGTVAGAGAGYYHHTINKQQDEVNNHRAQAVQIQKDINALKGAGSFSKNLDAAYSSAKDLDAGKTWRYIKGAYKASYATRKNAITDAIGSTNISDKMAELAQKRDELNQKADDGQKVVNGMRKHDLVQKGKDLYHKLKNTINATSEAKPTN